MKLALVLALSLSYAAPAAAQRATRRAEAEARHFFIPCPKAPLEKAAGCRQNQLNLVQHYVLAKSGDVSAMGEVAYVLDYDGTPDMPTEAGIRRNPRQACAWIVAAANSTTDASRLMTVRARYARKCAGFSPNETTAVMERAEVLLQELRDDPATAPEEGPSKDGRCLITSVPGTADPSDPPPPEECR